MHKHLRFICCFMAFILLLTLIGCNNNDTISTSGDISSTTSNVSSNNISSTFSDLSSDDASSDISSVSSSVSSNNVSSSAPVVPTIDPNHPYYNVILAVSGLDGTRHGYGFGLDVDPQNRPWLAQSQQNELAQYGMTAITNDTGKIYLTFDEGYEAGYTSRILDVLKEKNCTATFFVTMHYVKAQPALVRRMINEGHVIGNHSTTHPSMPTIKVEQMIDEIMSLHNYVLENFGYEMKLFRPPTGAYSVKSLEVARLLGYRTVEWSFAYEDWDEEKQPDPTYAYNYITSKTHGGAIYLLHAVSRTNTEVIGSVIDYWRNLGYTVEAYPNISPSESTTNVPLNPPTSSEEPPTSSEEPPVSSEEPTVPEEEPPLSDKESTTSSEDINDTENENV